LIDEDRLYLRVDDETREAFASAGSEAFVYPGRNGPMLMKKYWSLPEDAIDDPEQAARWGRMAWEAAKRGEAKKGPKKAAAKAAPREKTPSPRKAPPAKKAAAPAKKVAAPAKKAVPPPRSRVR